MNKKVIIAIVSALVLIVVAKFGLNLGGSDNAATVPDISSEESYMPSPDMSMEETTTEEVAPLEEMSSEPATPSVDMETTTPDVTDTATDTMEEIETPEVTIETPEVKIETPEVKMDAPEVDVEMTAPEVKMDAPEVKIETPEVDVEVTE